MKWNSGLVFSIAFIVMLFLGSISNAADFDQGKVAYDAGDYKKAIAEWLPLAIEGNPSAQFYLDGIYAMGLGVPQNYKESFKWYQLSADQGFALAQFNLGLIYDIGQGVPQDKKKPSNGIDWLPNKDGWMHNTIWPKSSPQAKVYP